jgi:hypothetical protein
LDEASCAGRSGCKAVFCSDCKGGKNFAACQSPGDGDIACGPCPPACLAFDETTCKGRSDCQPLYCSDCKGGQRFTSCVPPGGGGFSCDGSCPAPCSNLTTLAACDARTDCHSVFFNPTGCGCIGAGCCAVFSRCADGAKATCTGTPTCQMATPHCEAPAYVVSYTASCYEGCARPTECAP